MDSHTRLDVVKAFNKNRQNATTVFKNMQKLRKDLFSAIEIRNLIKKSDKTKYMTFQQLVNLR